MSSLHGWGVKVCCPAFLCENQWQYRAYDDNTRTHLTRTSKNNVVRIDWSVRSSDMSTILTCLWHFGQRDYRIIMASWTTSLSMQCCRRYWCWSFCTKSPAFRVCKTGASPLPLTVDTLITKDILIFEMWCLRLSFLFHETFKGIAFQVLKTYIFFRCLWGNTL